MSSVSYFDSIAEKWNVIRSDYFEEKLKYEILSRVSLSDKVCADLGCGTGFISLALALDSKLVFSIDTSKNMLRELYNTCNQKGMKNIYPIKGSMDEIPLFDNSIDMVFTNMALHHVAGASKAINEMYRVLKNNGTLIISDVEEHDGQWAREEMHDEWLGFSHNQIKTWFENSGFKNIEITTTDLKCKGYSSKGIYTETGIFIAKASKMEG